MKISKEDKILIHVFRDTTNGQKVLKYLERVFFNDSVYEKGDPYHTAYRAGQQDVVGFIKQTLTLKEADHE